CLRGGRPRPPRGGAASRRRGAPVGVRRSTLTAAGARGGAALVRPDGRVTPRLPAPRGGGGPGGVARLRAHAALRARPGHARLPGRLDDRAARRRRVAGQLARDRGTGAFGRPLAAAVISA